MVTVSADAGAGSGSGSRSSGSGGGGAGGGRRGGDDLRGDGVGGRAGCAVRPPPQRIDMASTEQHECAQPHGDSPPALSSGVSDAAGSARDTYFTPGFGT